MEPASCRRTRVVQILTRLLASTAYTVDELAAALCVDARTVGRYVSGEIDVPIDRQICLARFLIEREPPLARSGRNMLGQIEAAIKFSQSTTALHNSAPFPTTRTFR